MPAWLSTFLASPRALAAVGAIVVAVAVGVTIVTVGGDDDSDDSTTAASTQDAPAEGTPTDGATPTPATTTPAGEAPDRDRYCPAFDEIRSGGLANPGDEEEGTVDLEGLGRTFADLIDRYDAAATVSPRSLRDDYARALGFLREGKKAVDSGDVDLIKALVVNLETLNDSMSAIASKSREFCG